MSVVNCIELTTRVKWIRAWFSLWWCFLFLSLSLSLSLPQPTSIFIFRVILKHLTIIGLTVITWKPPHLQYVPPKGICRIYLQTTVTVSWGKKDTIHVYTGLVHLRMFPYLLKIVLNITVPDSPPPSFLQTRVTANFYGDSFCFGKKVSWPFCVAVLFLFVKWNTFSFNCRTYFATKHMPCT